MHVEPWVWAVVGGATILLLLFDVFVLGRRPHVPSRREVTVALAAYVSLAVLFGLGVWYFSGAQYATEFFAGWLTEYSLSIDNLFIFIIIMSKFGVPRKYQQSALMVGIVIALIMRALFIAVGAAAIERFSWVFYLFGAFLIWTAWKLFREYGDDDEDDYEENALLKAVEKRFPVVTTWEHGTKWFASENGKRVLTPMFIVVLALGTTDIMFALDSIPAIFGLTKEPFLVLMANVFALMGLRQLFFLIGDLLQRLVYLSLGLSVLLAFIGVKLILHALHENELPFINGGHPVHGAPEIPTLVSLGAIVLILGVTTVLSLIKSKRDEAAGVPAGHWDDKHLAARSDHERDDLD